MNVRRRVAAVSYLNTAPLVWGMAQGPQSGIFDLSFTTPSGCADALRSGDADVGLAPVIALARQPDLLVVPGLAIASPGAVRSILLVSRKPMEQIASFAADTSSRTSVVLAQVILAKKYGARPRVRPYPPKLDEMLELADAALVIGDPALRLDPAQTHWRGEPVHVYDLGSEWRELTGLPGVFAVWAVKKLVADASISEVLHASHDYGRSRIDEIVETESARLGFSPDLVRTYLHQHVSFDLGEPERQSLDLFLRSAAQLGLTDHVPVVQYLEAPAVAGGA